MVILYPKNWIKSELFFSIVFPFYLFSGRPKIWVDVCGVTASMSAWMFGKSALLIPPASSIPSSRHPHPPQFNPLFRNTKFASAKRIQGNSNAISKFPNPFPCQLNAKKPNYGMAPTFPFCTEQNFHAMTNFPRATMRARLLEGSQWMRKCAGNGFYERPKHFHLSNFLHLLLSKKP